MKQYIEVDKMGLAVEPYRFIPASEIAWEWMKNNSTQRINNAEFSDDRSERLRIAATIMCTLMQIDENSEVNILETYTSDAFRIADALIAKSKETKTANESQTK
jgi:hypothetical protein